MAGASQLKSTSCATVVPVPLKAMSAVLPLVELLLIVISPLTTPVAVGLNCTCSDIDCDGFRVTGKLPPITLKPSPVIATELTVTGEAPVDVNVSDCLVAELTVTLPKLRLPELIVNCGLAAAPMPLRATDAVPPAN